VDIVNKTDLKEMPVVYEGIEWIHVAQKRDQWRVLLHMAMNIRSL
jgi:hypothetical protein